MSKTIGDLTGRDLYNTFVTVKDHRSTVYGVLLGLTFEQTPEQFSHPRITASVTLGNITVSHLPLNTEITTEEV